MTRDHTIIHPINLFELPNTLECRLTERRCILKSMQYNSFEQVTKRNVVIFSKPFENLHHSLLNSHTNLHALNSNLAIFLSGILFKLDHNLHLPTKMLSR